MNWTSVKNFVVTFVVSFILFEGVEAILEHVFDIDLDHYLTGFGIGAVILVGFKFHIVCCVVPAAIASFISHRKTKNCNHCEHD